jgi:hypothetical protein
VIQIKERWGKLTIFNIYNDCKHNNTLELLTSYHRKNINNLLGNIEMQLMHHLVWVGNLNRHCPCWDSMDNNSLFTKGALDKAEILIQAIADIGLDLALPAGTPTCEHSVTKHWSRLDQVFATEHTLEALAQCKALPMEQGLNMDHFLIISNFNLDVKLTPKKAISNFRDVNWKEFCQMLEGRSTLGEYLISLNHKNAGLGM